MSLPEFYSKINNDIREVGRSIVGVMDRVPFGYTVGNHLVGLPELLCLGLPANGMGMLNVWSEMMIDRGKAFANGELIDIGAKHPCMAILACHEDTRTDYTTQAGEFLDTQDYSVIQMLIPDQHGKFPGDPLCSKPYSEFPVLGVRYLS